MEINQFSAEKGPVEIHRAARFPPKVRNLIGQPIFYWCERLLLQLCSSHSYD